MTPEVASQVTNCNIAQELWTALQDFYGVQATSQKDFIKSTMQKTRKGGMKMAYYLSLMKGYADSLHLAGYPTEMKDLISCVIAGLRSTRPLWLL